MRQLRRLFLLLLIVTSSTTIGHAQTDNEPPYLYYYSQMLGGLIIEHADGTDSRHVGAELIPPGMSGIVGPGWSPSGKYFAVYGINYLDYNARVGSPYLMNNLGASVASWLNLIPTTSLMEWSPTGEDILLVVGNYRGDSYVSLGTFFWVIDAETGELLVEFGANLGILAYDMSKITWDVADERIIFYLAPQTYDQGNTYRVNLQFDGTTLREPVDAEEFQSLSQDFVLEENTNINDGLATSPSGRYEARGIYPTIMSDSRTGEEIELPIHSQGTGCRAYRWNADEQHLILLNGTLRAGGGCAGAVIGLTNSKGALWRELGSCSWGYPPCVDWLPERVDIDSLPPGSPTPIQLDPIRIDYEDQPVYRIGGLEIPDRRLRCDLGGTGYIVDSETQEILYTLMDMNCPYHSYDSLTNEGLQIVTAYDPVHELLATYHDHFETFVTIWTRRNGQYKPVLLLNSDGYALEFTEDGEYLRARNVNGWKVYTVKDILNAASAHSQ